MTEGVKIKMFFDEDLQFNSEEEVKQKVRDSVEGLDYVEEDSVTFNEVFMDNNKRRVEVVLRFKIGDLSLNSSQAVSNLGGDLNYVHKVSKLDY